MALKTTAVDRVPRYPGRVKLTPVTGQTNTYDLVRADSPTQEGTPLNAAFFNRKADALTENVTLYVSPNGNDTTGDGSSAKPYATVQNSLSTIPKNLDGFLATIHIAPGTYTGAIAIEYFTGGCIIFTSTAGSTVTFKGQITVRDAYAQIVNFNAVMDGAHIYVTQGGRFYTNDNAILTCNGGTYGLYAMYNSKVSLAGTTIVNNVTAAALRSGASCEVYVHSISGSGNNIGFQAVGGSLRIAGISLTANTLYITTLGGRIYGGSQTSIPSY